jgi:ABC-type polar amino acid transport system ATPase subunit
MIQARDLWKKHGGQDVLRGISMNVSRGEVAVILGPSGGGKSTFLRCLNGLENFDAGEVEIGGRTLTPALSKSQRETVLGAMRREVGMVFQQFNLFPHFSVIQNVMEAPIRVLGLDKEQAHREAAALLGRVGLHDKHNKSPSELSGGQQQRVAIARTLAMKPKAILFDEPTSALDPKMTKEVLGVIKQLAQEGQTMIVVTHGLEFARQVGNTVYIFHQGRVAESGPPSLVFESPKEAVTADFLNAARE